jgi:hypothetical protein
MFPLMRPCGGEFELWLAANATSDPHEETIEAGIARLTECDRRATRRLDVPEPAARVLADDRTVRCALHRDEIVVRGEQDIADARLCRLDRIRS